MTQYRITMRKGVYRIEQLQFGEKEWSDNWYYGRYKTLSEAYVRIKELRDYADAEQGPWSVVEE